MGSLTGNLAELLLAMRQDGRALIAVCEFSDDRYVQFWLQPGGRIVGEVVSNLNIGPSTALPPWAEERLREIGFHEADPVAKPNWWFESTGTRDDLRLSVMMNAAIYDALEERSWDSVSVRTWMAMVQPGDSHDDAHLKERGRPRGPRDD